MIWHSHDPDPDTVENEFKEEFYNASLSERTPFSSGKPGRLTNRGRIYIEIWQA